VTNCVTPLENTSWAGKYQLGWKIPAGLENTNWSGKYHLSIRFNFPRRISQTVIGFGLCFRLSRIFSI
jgi:hypothetical protein